MKALIAVLVRAKEVIPTARGFVVTPSYFAWAVYSPACCKPYTITEKHALSDLIFVQHQARHSIWLCCTLSCIYNPTLSIEYLIKHRVTVSFIHFMKFVIRYFSTIVYTIFIRQCWYVFFYKPQRRHIFYGVCVIWKGTQN